MNTNKGQITYFIIAGVMLILTANLLFFLTRSNNEKADSAIIRQISEVSLSMKPIEMFTTECLKKVTEDGVILAGKQGGYIELRQNYLQTRSANISYHYLDGKDISPSIRNVEKEIEEYARNNIESCIKGLKNFKDQGFDIKYDFSDINIEINKDNIAITSNLALEAIKGESKTDLPFIRLSLPVRLGYMLTTSKMIVGKEVAEPGWIDTKFINIFDFQIDLYSYNATNKVFYLMDGKYKVKGQPYVFLFANKFKLK